MSSSNRRRGIFAEAMAATQQDGAQTVPEIPKQSDRSSPSFAQRRIAGMAEAAKMTKKPIIRLKASDCSIWAGNARDYSALNEERLRSLIDSILAQGGNSVPALVRRTADADKPYEVVVGTRRHWAISWLNDNHYPEIEFTAIVDDVDDEAGFRLADIENREREDISDLERAVNYRDAIGLYYDGVQSRMAERLKISKSRLSELLLLPEIPTEVIAAFATPADIKVHHAVKLVPMLREPSSRDKLLEKAASIAGEQADLRLQNAPPLPAPAVLRSLLSTAQPRRTQQRAKPVLMSASGKKIGMIMKDQSRDGLTIALKHEADVSVDEVLDALRPVLEGAKFRSPK